MKRFRILVGTLVIVAAGMVWYLFRPELLFIDQTVSEAGPGAGERLLSGAFRTVAHGTEGTATVVKTPDGRRVLRLDPFRTSNGPAVRVVMVAAPDASDDAAVEKAGYVDLGPMKGNVGSQNYDIPADLDLARHRAVTIWCRRFGVNFGTAALR